MQIVIKYAISEACRRAELAQGRDATRTREVIAIPSAYLAALAKLKEDGSGVIEIYHLRRDYQFRPEAPGSMSGETVLSPSAETLLTPETAESWVRAQVEAQHAKCAELAREDAQRKAECAARDKANDEVRAAREAELATRRDRIAAIREERWIEPCRKYVIKHVPDYARAALDGADVSAKAKRHVLDGIRGQLAECGDLVEHERRADPERVSAPHAFAYTTLDKVQVTLDEHSALISKVEPKIVRVDTCPENGCESGWRTAVQVTLTWADGVPEVGGYDTNPTTDTFYVLADPAGAHTHEAGEGSDD